MMMNYETWSSKNKSSDPIDWEITKPNYDLCAYTAAWTSNAYLLIQASIIYTPSARNWIYHLHVWFSSAEKYRCLYLLTERPQNVSPKKKNCMSKQTWAHMIINHPHNWSVSGHQIISHLFQFSIPKRICFHHFHSPPSRFIVNKVFRSQRRRLVIGTINHTKISSINYQ